MMLDRSDKLIELSCRRCNVAVNTPGNCTVTILRYQILEFATLGRQESHDPGTSFIR